MDKVKSIRKPKAKIIKEENNNSNIDVVIFENTEKEIEDDNVNDNTNNINNTNDTNYIEETEIKETKEKKERKKREPKEPKPVKEKKKTKAELLKEEKLNETQRLNTLSNILIQETHETHDPHNLVIDKVQEDNSPSMLEISTRLPDKVYEYSTHITKLYHLSDLHIQLYKRHNEYQEVFNNVLDYLKKEKKLYGIPELTNKNIPIIALITGDILHSKSDLSPECIQLTYNFLKSLSNLMPLVIIPGNHDVNMNNKERLDALTPIIADLPKSNPIYYFLESGVYQLSNLMFYHASIFDCNIIPPIHTKQKNFTSIMLYHGRVNGAVLFNGLELTEDNNKTITPSAFANYDITCLGDIHKHQFITPNIAYAGSLIQQNLGEDINNHGLIKWNIESKTGQLIPIQNTWSYVTLYVDNKKANHQCLGKDNIHDTNCPLSHNIRVRVLYKNTPESFISDYITLLKMNHTVHEFSYQNDEFLDIQTHTHNTMQNETTKDLTLTSLEIQSSSVLQTSSVLQKQHSTTSIDITSPELQNKYIKEYIKENLIGGDITLTNEEINDIMELNLSQNKKLQDINNNTYSCNKFSGHYKLKRLEFSNLFAFGLNNVIDFTNFKGVVGIIAQNHLGKSALLDIIIYTLFDKFTRKGSAKDIMNIRSEIFSIKLDLAIGNWTYTIIKKGIRGNGKTNTVTTKIEFYRKHDIDETQENLEEDNAMKTKDLIKDYFGCYEDIIHTSFSVQHDNSCFVDAENTERRKELQRIMKFDIIDKLDSMAGTQLTKYKDIREHISKKINNDFIVMAKKSKLRAEKLIVIHTENKEYAKEKIKKLHQSILDTSNKLNNDCKTFLEEYNKEDIEIKYEDLNTQLQNNEKESSKLLSIITKDDTETTTLTTTATDLTLLNQKLIEEELTQNTIIKDANKKIKLLDKANELLYTSRKPSNIRIPNDINTTNTTLELTPENYLNDLKNKYNDKIKSSKEDNKLIEKQIIDLKEKEKNIYTNNETILALEKTLVKLPKSLLDLSEKLDIYEDKYKKALQKWISILSITQTDTLLTTPEYKNYETRAKAYFLAKEINTYKTKSNDDETIIKEKQNKLTQDNTKLKNELKQIRVLEEQIKQSETKSSAYKTKIEQIENDIANLEENKKIDDELKINKSKKQKYEKRISDTEDSISNIRTKMSLIVKYETLKKNRHFIGIELKQKEDILVKFDKYKDQINYNSIIQKEIDLLREELEDFNEVLEEIEKQFNTENTNMTKYSALLDQIRKDLAEHKAIEKNFKLYEIYKKAMKQLPYILLNKIQPLLEKKVNDLLSIITDFTIKFDISDSKIDIYIDRPMYGNGSGSCGSGSGSGSVKKMKTPSHNRYILINNGSGFERFISSLAIRIALLDISNLPKINFLAIDEGFSAFDTHNINNVGQILDYLKTKFDFILTISHLTQIKENSDIIIGLQKDENGYTKIIQ